jgi:hypothetical protein
MQRISQLSYVCAPRRLILLSFEEVFLFILTKFHIVVRILISRLQNQLSFAELMFRIFYFFTRLIFLCKYQVFETRTSKMNLLASFTNTPDNAITK